MAIEGRTEPAAEPRIRLGMVGGGEGAFIGAVHRLAARLDGRYELVAGALSSTPARARRSAAALGLDRARSYSDYRVMAEKEAERADGIEAVSIVTPNHLHAPVATAFLEAGIHVICDKPLTATLDEALALEKVVKASRRVFAVTYNYTGYPMVRQARAMVAEGRLGPVRLVQAEYPQDWLTEPQERRGNKQATWRTDPKQSGAGGSAGDIGTHAINLATFVTGLRLDAVAADIQSFVPGRKLDDNVNVLLRFRGGARGMLWASQVAVGSENGLKLRVFGERGGLEWRQEFPNQLQWTPYGEPTQVLSRGGAGVGGEAGRITRVPVGHPEGYQEAFGNLYAEIAEAIVAGRRRRKPDPAVLFPTVADGVAGVAFVDAVVSSSRKNAAWVKVARG
jgi:predicted dehydrogenase